MQGFLWLLLQMTFLLSAAALVFLWLGWRWRSQDARQNAARLEARVDAESAAALEACGAREAARAELETLSIGISRDNLELIEARERLLGMERQLLRLSDDLKAARQRAEQAELEQQKAAEQVQASLSETQKLRERIGHLQTPSPAAAAPAKAKRVPAASKPKRPAATEAQQTLARLEADLTTRENRIPALQQERDEWQRRADNLAGQGTRSEVALAKKNLGRSEKQLGEATRSLDQTRRQMRALRHSLEQAAAVTAPDDLSQITGIKSATSARLHAHGIRTFRQIADWTGEDLEAFSDLLGLGNRPQRDGWVEQARKLATGL